MMPVATYDADQLRRQVADAIHEALADGQAATVLPGPPMRTLHPGWDGDEQHIAVSDGFQIVACYRVDLTSVSYPLGEEDPDPDGPTVLVVRGDGTVEGGA